MFIVSSYNEVEVIKISVNVKMHHCRDTYMNVWAYECVILGIYKCMNVAMYECVIVGIYECRDVLMFTCMSCVWL